MTRPISLAAWPGLSAAGFGRLAEAVPSDTDTPWSTRAREPAALAHAAASGTRGFADPLMNPGWPDSPAPPDFLARPPEMFNPSLEDKLDRAGFHASRNELREARVDLAWAVRYLAEERTQAFALLERAGGAKATGLGQSFVDKFERGVQAMNRNLWNLQVREQRLLESETPTADQVEALKRNYRAALWEVGELRPLLESVRNFARIPGFKDLPSGLGGSGLVPFPSSVNPGSGVPMVTVTCHGGQVTVPIGTGDPCLGGGGADNPNEN